VSSAADASREDRDRRSGQDDRDPDEAGDGITHAKALRSLSDGVPEETLAAYFQPLQAELLDDPIVGPTLRRLTAEDPDIIAAVADVDRSQIRDCMARSPRERLRCAEENWNGIAKLRRGH
jgi:hypothetical protein